MTLTLYLKILGLGGNSSLGGGGDPWVPLPLYEACMKPCLYMKLEEKCIHLKKIDFYFLLIVIVYGGYGPCQCN